MVVKGVGSEAIYRCFEEGVYDSLALFERGRATKQGTHVSLGMPAVFGVLTFRVKARHSDIYGGPETKRPGPGLKATTDGI